MKAKLICYTLEKASPVQRTKLHRELYGYKDISNHGKYVYSRSGLISSIKAKKITDAVILVANQQAHQLISILKRYGAKSKIFEVLSKIKL